MPFYEFTCDCGHCERLQGFFDNWTEGQADSHRYKQMGNAVAVPVVQWVVNRLLEER